jgi:predicted nucleic acid-binding protein
VTIVQPQSVPRVVSGDVDDDHVLALAVAAKAAFIVSGDRAHLLPIGRHAGIAIITPREAMDLFRP